VKAYGTVDGHSHGASKTRPGPSRKNGKVNTLIVHPDVWALALILAGGELRLIRDRKPTSVVVVNP
jgi:hypothetical protein